MKIRIISDGIPENTQIVNAETGERIEGITRAVWRIDASGDFAEIMVTFKVTGQVSADLIGEWDDKPANAG